MFKKKLLAMVMALGMAGAMAACGGSSGSTSTTAAAAGNSDTATTAAAAAAADDGETYTLIFSHENAESSLVHQLTLQFKEEVEAATNGHVIIDVYPNSQLGSKTDNWQGICDNTIQMVLGLGSRNFPAGLFSVSGMAPLSDGQRCLSLLFRRYADGYSV